MEKKILVTLPLHDDTTHYISNWCKEALDTAKKKGIPLLELEKEKANVKSFESMMKKQEPKLVILNGHGNEKVVCGHKDNPLVVAGKNDNLLGNKIIYAIACKSGLKLGPSSIKSGADTYIGYQDDFVFFYDPKKISRPLKDKTAEIFLEPSNELIISLVKGNEAEECKNRSQQHFRDKITQLLSSETTEEETSMARYLWWDMRNQVIHGDGTAKFE